jgi:hypothetical protein
MPHSSRAPLPLLGRRLAAWLAALALTLLMTGPSAALTVLDFSSGTWDLAATNGDFHSQASFLVATDDGAVDPNSPADGTWGWGDSRSCDAFGCGAPLVHLATVTFNQGLDFFDFLRVTILENPGGMTFTADGGLSMTFPSGDIGLKMLNWTDISVLQIHNLAVPTRLQGSNNIVYAYIDNLQLVPEPTTALLIGALLAMGFKRRFDWRS